MTHPIQYHAPWFRFISEREQELDLRVLYASEPTPAQQGTEFGREFEWDRSITEGYANRVLCPAKHGNEFGSDSFFGLDAPGIGKAIQQINPDLVLLAGWHSLAQARAILACRRRRIQMLYRGDSHLGSRAEKGCASLRRVRTRWLLRRFDRYLSVGSLARQYLRHFGIDDALIFDAPHAVDNEFFASSAAPFQRPDKRSEARRAAGFGPEEFVVLFVGKLDANKRPNDVLRACALMKNPPSALMVGAGPLDRQCRSLGTELGIKVVWEGFLNQTELGRAYAMADCLVLPSESETWGLVVNEALATGLPCVVSDGVGCAPDLVEPDRTGIVFPFGDAVALAHALERVRAFRQEGGFQAAWCREVVQRHSFEAATKGLLAACRSSMAGV